MTLLLLRTTIAMLVAFGGGLIGVAWGSAARRRLNLLVYGAVGALLAVTVFDILPDAKTLLPWPAFLAATGSGYALFWMLGKHVSSVCPACSLSALDGDSPGPERFSHNMALLMIALGLHSAMDGIAVVVGDQIAGRPDFALLFAVAFHKLPEGLALALLLLGAGHSRRSALLWTFGVESTTEIGGLVGVLGLRHVSGFGLGLVFAHVGGGFVYLLLSALGLFAKPHGRSAAHTLTLPLITGGGLAFTLTAGMMLLLRRFAP